jgi:hypothetical protein
MSDKIFADGFSFKKRENAPDFVVGSLSVKVEDAIGFLKEHANQNGWVNLNINVGKSGKPYVELDTFEPKKTEKAAPKKKAATKDEDVLPF